MSLLRRPLYGEEPGFTNLFRMLDAFENYNSSQLQPSGGRLTQSFSLKFDVSETDASFELHGELPGIDRKDVKVDFSEPQTIVISGRVERSYTSGAPPTELQATSQTATEGVKENGDKVAPGKKAKPQERFWHQERSVGQFSRTFTFPVPIDEANTHASLKDGVLQVSVPKSNRHSTRNITVN